MESNNSLVPTAYTGKSAKSYDAKRFRDARGIQFANLEQQQLEIALQQLEPGADVIEVGCGTARFSESLARKEYRVVASDPSPDMVEIAEAKLRDFANASVVLEEGAKLSFPDGSFDFAFAIRVLNQTESRDYALAVVKELIRVARPGGYILVEFVNRRRPFAKASKDVRLTASEVCRVADDHECIVIRRSGILVFSQTVLNRTPIVLLPLWRLVERIAMPVCWRWASRCYVLLKRRGP